MEVRQRTRKIPGTRPSYQLIIPIIERNNITIPFTERNKGIKVLIIKVHDSHWCGDLVHNSLYQCEYDRNSMTRWELNKILIKSVIFKGFNQQKSKLIDSCELIYKDRLLNASSNISMNFVNWYIIRNLLNKWEGVDDGIV